VITLEDFLFHLFNFIFLFFGFLVDMEQENPTIFYISLIIGLSVIIDFIIRKMIKD